MPKIRRHSRQVLHGRLHSLISTIAASTSPPHPHPLPVTELTLTFQETIRHTLHLPRRPLRITHQGLHQRLQQPVLVPAIILPHALERIGQRPERRRDVAGDWHGVAVIVRAMFARRVNEFERAEEGGEVGSAGGALGRGRRGGGRGGDVVLDLG